MHIGAEQGIFLILKRHSHLTGKGVGMNAYSPFARRLANAAGLHTVLRRQTNGTIRCRCVGGFHRGHNGKGVKNTLIRPSAVPLSVSITLSAPASMSSKSTSRRCGCPLSHRVTDCGGQACWADTDNLAQPELRIGTRMIDGKLRIAARHRTDDAGRSRNPGTKSLKTGDRPSAYQYSRVT